MRMLTAMAAAGLLAACGGGEEADAGRRQAQVHMRAQQGMHAQPPALAVSGGPYDAVVQSFRGQVGQPQGAQIFYGGPAVQASVPDAFRKQNMLTIVGRNPDFTAGHREAAAKGAIVAPYLNAVLHSRAGPYQSLLYDDSECGPAIGPWAGTGTRYGTGADVRVPHYADKLLCVVRRIQADHPHIRALFLDDFGPGWSGYDKNGTAADAPESEECQARAALGPAFERLRAANLNLLFFVNGGWSRQFCGGWPEAARPGLHFALPVYEHHSVEHIPSANVTYGSTSQWLRDRTGQVGAFVITNTAEESAAYARLPWAAWIAQQTTPDYTTGAPRPVVGVSHAIGLSFGTPYGITSAGDQWSGAMVADRLRATPVTLLQGGRAHSASVLLDGGAGAQAGTQAVRLALYADAGGQPGQLLSVGREVKVAAGSLPAWYTSELPAPPLLHAGTYWIALWTGETALVARNNGRWGAAGSYRAMTAAYSPSAMPPAKFTSSSQSGLVLSAFVSVQH